VQAPPVLVEGLVVKYGSFVAVDNVSFTVGRGEIYGLLGPNGAGKTSTLKVLTGLLKPASGRIEVFGRPLSDEVAVKRMMGGIARAGLNIVVRRKRNSLSGLPALQTSA
jgi:ABC-2 type transport system ATP-binding protein